VSRHVVNEGNRYFHDPEILQRVIAGLDFAQLMQGRTVDLRILTM
jgi:hypothetical protein